MRYNAKAITIAIALTISPVGIAIASREILSDSVQLPDALQFVRAHFLEALAIVRSSTAGRVLTLVALVLVVESFVVGWKGSSLSRLLFGRSSSAILDVLTCIFVHLNLMVFLEIALTLGASVLVSQFISWVSSFYGWSRIALPSDGVFEIALGFAIYWLAISFVQYWGHRIMHTPLLWHLHRFHHAATELNIVTAFRTHPLEPVVLKPVLLVSPLIFFDVPPRILLIYFILGTVSDLLAHSQLSWHFGWIGRWAIQSPRVHQVHHSADQEHRDLHFSICPLWDHLFGTWYKGTKQPSKFGIPDSTYEIRPLTQFMIDTWTFYGGIFRSIGSPLQRLQSAGALVRNGVARALVLMDNGRTPAAPQTNPLDSEQVSAPLRDALRAATPIDSPKASQFVTSILPSSPNLAPISVQRKDVLAL
jgi:sterol desaturase/sphingolipid hydroxylase (fatty acid hydroxylase superfamily)